MNLKPPEERRRDYRFSFPFPARVRAVDAGGETFQADVVIDNISAGGLYIRLSRSVRTGEEIFAVIRLSTEKGGNARVPRLAMLGTVVRAEPKVNGECGVAVTSRATRFL
ncbi:MAG TPA: PilZ domain-containing protein [Acidobacteriota bacterium]|jgi:hypothetical protein|nr:PilZ domain-containing protein [Acidobacteriota bacterium]